MASGDSVCFWLKYRINLSQNPHYSGNTFVAIKEEHLRKKRVRPVKTPMVKYRKADKEWLRLKANPSKKDTLLVGELAPHDYSFLYSFVSDERNKTDIGYYCWDYAYLHVKGREDLLFFDVAFRMNDNEEKAKAVSPARYERSGGQGAGRESTSSGAFLGQIFSSLCQGFGIEGGNAQEWLQKAGIVQQKVKLRAIKKGGKGSNVIEVTSLMTITRFLRGEFAGALPWPGFMEGQRGACGPKDFAVYVVAPWKNGDPTQGREVSETAWLPLKNLTEALQNAGSQVTLILGEPGSGKEALSRACHLGSLLGRQRALWIEKNAAKEQSPDGDVRVKLADGSKERASDVEVISLAGMDGGVLQRSLSKLVKKVDRREDEAGEEAGEQVRGGSIIMDEFDKSNDPGAIGAIMLRMLEAREYNDYDEDGNEKGKKTYNEVSWIMAGSFTKTAPENTVPRDFWSRLKAVVRTSNPMENNPGHAATLFMLFFVERVMDSLGWSKRSSQKLLLKALVMESDGYGEITVIQKALGVDPRKGGRDAWGPLLRFAFRFAASVRTERIFPADLVDSSRAIRQAAHAAADHIVELAKTRPEVALFSDGNQMREKEQWDEQAQQALDKAHRTLRVARGPQSV